MRHSKQFKLAIIIATLLLPVVSLVPVRDANAAELIKRKILLADSRASVTTSHEVSFDFASTNTVGSFQVEYCGNDPLFGTPCTAPSGMDLSAAVLSSESGETGFSIDGANSTPTKLVLTRTAVPVTPGAASYLFTNIVNPDTTGALYARLQTFGSIDGTGVGIDEGGVAMSITEPVDVAAFVPPRLTFCLGTSIPTNNCSSAVGNDIDFGEFDNATTGLATTQMLVTTNAVDGYSITVTGTTMTSGNNEIEASSTPIASTVNTSQFGINLVDNSSPNIGSNPSGVGTGFVTPGYASSNLFKFTEGDVVAQSVLPTDYNRFTTSYIVNVDEDQPAGVYSTTLTFTALASF